MADSKLVTFDNEYRLRVLDTEKYDASKNFKDNCIVFTSRMEELREMAQTYARTLKEAAECIEVEKLRAIGIRNQVAAMREDKNSKKFELERVKAAKQRQLESLTEEVKSLQSFVDEQEGQIARLQGVSSL